LLRDLEVLATIEEEKRQLQPGDPKLVELSVRIEEIAGRVLVGTVQQRQLSQIGEREVAAGSPGAPAVPIDDMPRPIDAILAEWREAERRLSAAAPGSVDESEGRALVERLRDEYRRAHEAARDR
jgi:hypothetical protein